MVSWFDAPNVIFCIAFLAHVWLFDDSLPLKEWHSLTEGVVRGVNLNKCVRNLLRILKYRLFVTPTQAKAALLSLEYTDPAKETHVPRRALGLPVSATRECVRLDAWRRRRAPLRPAVAVASRS